MPMRKSPRRQLEHNLASLLRSGQSTNVKFDKMTESEIRKRIEAIRMWDTLKEFTCPLCGTEKSIKLDSKADRAINLKCEKCGTHYEWSISRSLGARIRLR